MISTVKQRELYARREEAGKRIDAETQRLRREYEEHASAQRQYEASFLGRVESFIYRTIVSSFASD